jgi:uncharacterized membrane protein
MQSQQQIGVIYKFTGMDEKIIYKIEILQLIESKYNIEIKDEEVENILTLEDLIELIKIKKIYEYTSRHNKLD